MYCENCGNKINNSDKFCTKCGHSVSEKGEFKVNSENLVTTDKWWNRLLKVFYIISYLPLLLIIPLVWSSNAPYCTTYTYSTNYCYGSVSGQFWYSVLTLIVYLVVLRLIKLAVLYVVSGQKVQWKKELKRLF